MIPFDAWSKRNRRTFFGADIPLPNERSKTMFKLYKDGSGEWRWRLVAANDKTIADSAEGYKRRYECVKAIDRVRALASAAPVHEIVADSPKLDATQQRVAE